MQRSAILTATLLLALGLTYVGCTQDFNQFEPTGGGATGGTGGASASSSSSAGGAAGTGGTGGAGGTGGTMASSSSSSSGTGGGMPCQNNGDCPADTDCINWSCTMGQCAAQNEADGTLTSMQMQGDCKRNVCDGNGGEKVINSDMDLPPSDNNPCTDQACSNGAPTFPNRPAGTTCNNTDVCDGMGACLECIIDADCNAMAGETCSQNKCVSCSDGVMNGDETAIDCGGATCGACDGDVCAANMDCASTFCADGVCCENACTGTCLACNVAGMAGKCTNIASGMEDTNAMTTCMTTSVCNGAGACKLKAGESCTMNAQCLSNTCSGGGANKTCQP